MKKVFIILLCMASLLVMTIVTCTSPSPNATNAPATSDGNGDGDGDGNGNGGPITENDRVIDDFSKKMLPEGRQIFRYDSFGSEAYWGDQLQLHKAIAGEKNGGVGAGLSPKAALAVGLKVDMDAVPASVANGIKSGKISLDDPANTIALIKAESVVGIKGVFDNKGTLTSVGITCAICHSTVDNAFTAGIGHRLDGWPNRDLNVGQIVLLAPNAKIVADRLGVGMDVLTKVLSAWGPGHYDAEVNEDGKALRPDGKPGTTLIPAAYGLAGINLHTYTGWGSVPYWNAYVAITQMHGQGTFFDPRMNNPTQFPLAVKTGDWNIRPDKDLVTSKLAALQYYQLSIPAPKPKEGSYDKAAADRGEQIFMGKGTCARCHVPPLFTEPGHSIHDGKEIGIDNFQAERSPAKGYRTMPLAGVSFRSQGGYYHDGRFADLKAVVLHYNSFFQLNMTDAEANDLVEYLKSL